MVQARKALLIINASSGFDEEKRDAPDLIRNLLEERGFEARIERVAAGMNIDEIAQNAVREGYDLVVAGGGDGTLRTVAHALSGSEAIMGVLPVGTLNHFARDMEIPIDVEGAAQIIANGVPVRVDVAEVNERVFINNSVIGLYPAYRFERESRERRGWNKTFAMLAAMLATIRRYPFLNLTLHVDGERVQRRTPYILVSNNEHAFESDKPWHRPSMTDGKLSVYVLRNHTRIGLIITVARMLLGHFKTFAAFEVFQAEEVTVETRRKSMRVAIDGEVLRLPTPLQYKSRKLALRVMAPAGSERVAQALAEERS